MAQEKEEQINTELNPPTINIEDGSQPSSASNQAEPNPIPIDSSSSANYKDEFIAKMNVYIHSANDFADKAAEVTTEYGNPIVEFSAKMASKFKEFFNLA